METEKTSEELVRGQAEIWQHMFSFVDSMVLKCAVELRIADIIHSHEGAPMTLSQIASCIDSPSPDIPYLTRIMRLLVRKNIFTVHHPSDGGESLYGLTHFSKWLLHGSDLSLAPMILMQTHPSMMAPLHCLSKCVKEGGIAFEMTHGRQVWDFASQNPEFNNMFNDGMACAARIIAMAIMIGYKDGFGCIGSLVDVGGGTGTMVAEIVKSHPHIKATNFDLPHVIATAPLHDGVYHVGGDMFQDIPNADAVFMKWIMHDWTDEDCVKILRNCRKAIPEKNGKVIIVDHVLQPDGNGTFDDVGFTFDLLMMADTSGGKERSELQWKKLLEEGGFPRYKVISIPEYLLSIIEAYPE